MSTNGQPPRPLSLPQRVDPPRVHQLEQQTTAQSQLLVARALSDVSNFSNALQFLIEQADGGHPAARQVLRQLVTNLDRATSAAAGITLPRTPAPPGS